jgi:multidrug efflux pump subunit AcrA (membrane-fusion protein)
MKNRGLLIFIFFVIFAGFIFSGCGRGEKEPDQPPSSGRMPVVSVEQARQKDVSLSINITGEVVATKSVAIVSTLDGYVTYYPWREGDTVKAGEKLVEINRELYTREVAVAETSLRVAEAKLRDMQAGARPEEIIKAKETVKQIEESLNFVRNDLERVTQLVETGALPGEAKEKATVEYVSRQAALDSAKAHLQMLETGYTETAIAVQKAAVDEAAARFKLAQAKLSESIITAPFNGTVTKTYIRQGETASLKSPLMEITDFTSLVVRVAVPESYAGELKKGLSARVTLDAYPNRAFSGRINRIYPELDKDIRTRTAEILLTDKTNILPGMFARVEIYLQKAENAVVIPVAAINISPSGEKAVFVIQNNTVARRKVKTGIEEKGEIEIVSGIIAGEDIVVKGIEKLKDGMEIRVAESK